MEDYIKSEQIGGGHVSSVCCSCILQLSSGGEVEDYIKSEQIGGGSCFKCLLFLYIIVEQWRRSGGLHQE